MSEAKIEIKIGQIQFSGQGGQDWVAKQLDKILSQAEKLIQIAPPLDDGQIEPKQHSTGKRDSSTAQKPLATFLNEKAAQKNQVKKFLATAIWLHAKGKDRLKTAEISSALTSANQKSLSNASMSLTQNVKKGHCEKVGNEFFVTEEGYNSF